MKRIIVSYTYLGNFMIVLKVHTPNFKRVSIFISSESDVNRAILLEHPVYFKITFLGISIISRYMYILYKKERPHYITLIRGAPLSFSFWLKILTTMNAAKF